MSEEYEDVFALLQAAEEKKDELLNKQQDFNMATVNARKLGLKDRLDRFVALQASAASKAAEALQKKVDMLQEGYNYWNGPTPASERAKLGPQIAEVSQLVEQLTTLLATLVAEPE